MEGSGAPSLKVPAPTVPVEVLDTVFEVGLEARAVSLPRRAIEPGYCEKISVCVQNTGC